MTKNEANQRLIEDLPVFVCINRHIATKRYFGPVNVRNELQREGLKRKQDIDKAVQRLNQGFYVDREHTWYRKARLLDFTTPAVIGFDQGSGESCTALSFLEVA